MKKATSKQKKPVADVRLVSSETPWGKAQSAEEVGPGIIRYTTASHGGYFLNATANGKVSPILKKSTFCGQGLKGWYEEDCDWAIVVYTFPQFFDEKHLEAAIATLKDHHADAWKRISKNKIQH